MNYLTRLALCIRTLAGRFQSDELGATATEYGITVGFIAIVIVAGVGALGIAVNDSFNDLTTGVKAALGIP